MTKQSTLVTRTMTNKNKQTSTNIAIYVILSTLISSGCVVANVLSTLTNQNATLHVSPSSATKAHQSAEKATPIIGDKIKQTTVYELDTQESGYLPSYIPQQHDQQQSIGYGGSPSGSGAYGTISSSNYDSNSGYGDNNKYAKQGSDWSLYDQGAHGLYDKYGDKAWTDSGYQNHASNGKHDQHSNVQNSHGSDQGNGYYSRDRGYGYERQYAFDRVIDSKSHTNNHQYYANSHGLKDAYGANNQYNFNKGGHEKYGLANKYGHGYRQLGAHDDYASGQSNSAVASPSYSTHIAPLPPPPPLYRSYYSNAQYPQMPSYY